MATLRGLGRLLPGALLLAGSSCGGRADSADRGKPGVPAPGEACGDGACPPLVDIPPPTMALPGGTERADSSCGQDGMVGELLYVKTQAQLDALEGCARIAGSLTLYTFEGMDVRPLQGLQTVDGTVTVYGDSAPNEGVLDGLVGLEQVGGLHLYGLSAPSLEPLARLQRVGIPGPDTLPVGQPLPIGETQADIAISNCTQLTSLTGLASLGQVSAITLTENERLSSLAGLTRAPRLERLVVQSCPLSTLEGVEALNVSELTVGSSALRSLAGLGDATELRRLVLSKNVELASLEGGRVPAQMDVVWLLSNPLTDLRGLEGLREVGSLSVSNEISGGGVESLAGLDNLERAGILSIEQQGRLSSLSALGSLVQVGIFELGDDAALATLAGLTSLRQVSSLSLSGAPALTSLEGMANVAVQNLSLSGFGASSLAGLEGVSVAQSLDIEGAGRLVSLQGLPQLASRATLRIYGAPDLGDVAAFASLDALSALSLANTGVRELDALSGLRQLENLELNGNAQLVQVDGVGAAAGLVALSVSENPALRRLPTFSNVEQPTCVDCAGFTLHVANNALLETGPAFPLLERASYIAVANNPALSSLSGLAALRAVEVLEIHDNPSLVTLALPDLERATSILIRANAALDDVPLTPLRALPGAQVVKIVSNKAGPSLLNPCPWADNICDEDLGDCAPGSDRDCDGTRP